jgi:Tol biopolymer transport system component/tRNA A-37 threonylcarbamoyl transferase component Bud32
MNRSMQISAGDRLGRFEVLGLLGSGGMGDVYLARDSRLAREVAIKVLPHNVSADLRRVARFEREARALAALNHPNIAAIYGLEEFESTPDVPDSRRYGLVLELVEGETLEQRIRRASLNQKGGGGVTWDEALGLARQIAEALEAAHEKGIVHRDLKPANIRVTPDGVAKVLDFGVAKLVDAPDIDDRGAQSATLTLDATRVGAIVGTAGYMSPEQARGAEVDTRADIWAFGCVLYEMLTGRPAFARATVAETMAAVLDGQPDWSVLPDAIPVSIRRLLARCLERDVKRRARDIGDVRLELEDACAAATDVRNGRIAVGVATSVRTWRGALAAGVLLVVAASIGWFALKDAAEIPSTVTRTTLTLPANLELDTTGTAGPLALSPDGRRIAYVASGNGRTRLYVRRLDAFDAEPLPDTEGAQYPFFSPDGEWVAFFADGKLKRVSIRGGAPITICDAPSLGRGGTWSATGTIVFDPGFSGLMRVPATGGPAEALTTRDATMDRQDLTWPWFLPNGRDLLVTVGTGSVTSSIVVLSLDAGEWHQLGPGSQAQYLPSGHLVYHAIGVREGELHAAAFDLATLSLHGAARAVVDDVFRAPDGGAAYFAVAQNGTLAFTPGGYARTLVRVDRNGRRAPLFEDRRGFRKPQVSPDGLRVAVTIDPRPSQVWVYDIARRSRIPLATDDNSLFPSWTPDGKRIAYTSNGDIFWRAADGDGPAVRLLSREQSQFPTAWSSDGQFLIFDDGSANQPNGYDIWMFPLRGEPRPLIATPANEEEGRLSPDGRWLAYSSNESGRFEVYVRPFPNVNDGKWPISIAGGQHAVWSPDGRELFYALGSSVIRVPVDTRGPFVAGTPEMLFSGPFDLSYTNFAVTKDGAHFVMVEVDPQARPTHINIVLNWPEEVEQLTALGR